MAASSHLPGSGSSSSPWPSSRYQPPPASQVPSQSARLPSSTNQPSDQSPVSAFGSKIGTAPLALRQSTAPYMPQPQSRIGSTPSGQRGEAAACDSARWAWYAPTALHPCPTSGNSSYPGPKPPLATSV